MIGVKKVAMVILMQNDLEKAVSYYKQLGFELIFHIPTKWAEFRMQNLQIGLCPIEQKMTLNRTGIVLEVGDLNAFYQAHKEELGFLDQPVAAAHGIMTSIQDPSGNIIDLYQPTPEKVKNMSPENGQVFDCSSHDESNLDKCCKTEQKRNACC